MAIRLTGKLPRRTTDGIYKYILAEAAREASGFFTMEEYVRRRQNTAAQYIATRSLLDLCEGSERDLVARVEMWWYKQELIDLAEAQDAEEAVS